MASLSAFGNCNSGFQGCCVPVDCAAYLHNIVDIQHNIVDTVDMENNTEPKAMTTATTKKFTATAAKKIAQAAADYLPAQCILVKGSIVTLVDTDTEEFDSEDNYIESHQIAYEAIKPMLSSFEVEVKCYYGRVEIRPFSGFSYSRELAFNNID